MEFTECGKERLTLTLKSGLLCAALLMPATVLAQSLETVRGDDVTSVTNTVTANTAVMVDPPIIEKGRMNTIPADTASAAISA